MQIMDENQKLCLITFFEALSKIKNRPEILVLHKSEWELFFYLISLINDYDVLCVIKIKNIYEKNLFEIR